MSKIEEIKHQLSIAELLNRLGLKPNSSGFIYSIYRKEKTPSLKIYFSTNSYYDFATDIGGDVLKFYADYYKIDIAAAIKELAGMLNIIDFKSNTKPVQYIKPKPIESYELLKDNSGKPYNEEYVLFEERAAIMEYDGGLPREKAERYAFQDVKIYRAETRHFILESFYKYGSKNIPEDVVEYLTKQRKLNTNIILDFKLFGINPKQAEKYLKDIFTEYQLRVSGLFTTKGYFIFSKHTCITPYIENGKIVFMKARSISGAKQKYIGLSGVSAKRFYNYDIIKNTNEVLIVEGEFDALKLIQETGNPTVAIGGVGNIPDLNILKNKEIYILFDNDAAGDKASKQLFEQLKANDITTHLLKIDTGKTGAKDISELIK